MPDTTNCDKGDMGEVPLAAPEPQSKDLWELPNIKEKVQGLSKKGGDMKHSNRNHSKMIVARKECKSHPFTLIISVLPVSSDTICSLHQEQIGFLSPPAEQTEPAKYELDAILHHTSSTGLPAVMIQWQNLLSLLMSEAARTPLDSLITVEIRKVIFLTSTWRTLALES